MASLSQIQEQFMSTSLVYCRYGNSGCPLFVHLVLLEFSVNILRFIFSCFHIHKNTIEKWVLHHVSCSSWRISDLGHVVIFPQLAWIPFQHMLWHEVNICSINQHTFIVLSYVCFTHGDHFSVVCPSFCPSGHPSVSHISCICLFQ